uniref:28 kDa heat- and acid-stable phosphoprotein isoform X2 n=1 Tax=Castor canadensis TaxID=51338 RepID=A0A8C0WNK9_CASCN|nr:28 kDa heat- and acid-stable phosphoprotein isoform X2 [Castor canadensis]
MPKGGRKGGHKGRARQYTSPEEIDAQLQAEEQKAREEEEQEEGGDGASGDPKKEKKSLDSDESEDEDDDYQQKRKGVEGLIDIENPNRVAQTTKKVTQLDLDGPKELSRRERFLLGIDSPETTSPASRLRRTERLSCPATLPLSNLGLQCPYWYREDPLTSFQLETLNTKASTLPAA